MTPKLRPYQTDADFWRMREFLREIFPLNDCRERSWQAARLEYVRAHICPNCLNSRMEDVTWLWEADGRLLAFLMPDGRLNDAHACVHPALRTPELEEEIITTAEERMAAVARDGSRRLRVWASDHDSMRQDILARRRYAKDTRPEQQWRRQLDSPIPDVTTPPGYTLRALGDGLEVLERCYASGLGFHEGDISIAVSNRADVDWYRVIQSAPLYRRDLDLVAIAPDGAIASFCTIWFDDVTRSAYFEPVATVPSHQRRGLAKALLTEGLRRLQRMGALTAFVSGFSPAANALYQSVMGPDHELYEPWVKEW